MLIIHSYIRYPVQFYKNSKFIYKKQVVVDFKILKP